MSIADHFEQAPDARYIRDYDTASARRQLNVSVVLVAAFALAAVTLGTILRFESPSAPMTTVSQTYASPPAYAGRL